MKTVWTTICARARACVSPRYDELYLDVNELWGAVFITCKYNFFGLTCADDKQNTLKITDWKIDLLYNNTSLQHEKKEN